MLGSLEGNDDTFPKVGSIVDNVRSSRDGKEVRPSRLVLSVRLGDGTDDVTAMSWNGWKEFDEYAEGVKVFFW